MVSSFLGVVFLSFYEVLLGFFPLLGGLSCLVVLPSTPSIGWCCFFPCLLLGGAAWSPPSLALFSSPFAWCCLVSSLFGWSLLFGGAASHPLHWVGLLFPMSSVGWCCLRGAVPKLERNACQRATLDACEASSGARAGSTAEAAWKWEARVGGTARRVRGCTAGTRSTREWTALFQKTCGQHRFKARRSLRRSECGWHRQTALSERVRVALPGSDTWTSADSPVEAGPSYRSCTPSPQRRRGVTVSSLIETICEL